MGYIFHHSSVATVQVQFAQQNYTVTEGASSLDITLTTDAVSMDSFIITLQHMDGSATGEYIYNISILLTHKN